MSGHSAEKDAAGRRGCVVPKRHPGDAAVCATSCWQERIGKGHCPAEPLPSAEKDATRRGGGWNYRICRETIDGDFFFTLREVYYDDGGNPNGWTADPIDFAGDTWKDVAEGISLAASCIGTTILDLDTRQWIKPGPKSSTRVLPPAETQGGAS